MIAGPLLLVVVLAVIMFTMVAAVFLGIHLFLVVMAAAYITGILVGMPVDKLSTAVNTEIGNLMRSIGLVIVTGTIVGVIL